MRSMGVAEALRPRPVSLFEPLPGLAQPSSGLPMEITAERLAPGPPALNLPPRSAAGPPLAGTRAAGGEPALLRPVLDAQFAAQPPRPVGAAETGWQAPGRSGAAVAAPAGGTLETASLAAEPARPLVVERVVTPPGEAKTAGIFEPPARPVEPPRRTPTPGVIAQPRVRRVADVPVPGQAPPGAMPAPAPTVQVTIGRIEVRAAPPAPAPAQRATRPAPMTLDEYLRQRKGGTS
jgi:hypothetical protein